MMPEFRCACGTTFGDKGNDDSWFVTYSLSALGTVEFRIAEAIAAFSSVGEKADRARWLASYFGNVYPAKEQGRGVIEDIVSRELNGGCIAMFRCPSCKRVALCDPERQAWAFFRPERDEAAG